MTHKSHVEEISTQVAPIGNIDCSLLSYLFLFAIPTNYKNDKILLNNNAIDLCGI